MFRHPAGTAKVTLDDMTSTIWLLLRIEAEQDFSDFGPVGSIIGRVEHSQIEFHMRSIIISQFRAFWRSVKKIGWHVSSPIGEHISTH